MGKELKFRIWDGNNNRYEYPELIELNAGLEYEQFTGLHDKNGKEIYEGDICSISGKYKPVLPSLDASGNGFESEYINSEYVVKDIRYIFQHYHVGNAIDGCMKVEVVGNIHENPSYHEPILDDGLRSEDEVKFLSLNLDKIKRTLYRK